MLYATKAVGAKVAGALGTGARVGVETVVDGHVDDGAQSSAANAGGQGTWHHCIGGHGGAQLKRAIQIKAALVEEQRHDEWVRIKVLAIKMFRRWRLHRVSSSEKGSRQCKEKDIEKGRYTRRDEKAVRRTHRQKVHRQTDSSQVPRATFYPIDVPDL